VKCDFFTMNFLDVPRDYMILDLRPVANLGSSTLSGFRKIDVREALEKSIQENNLEGSCRWTVELHCSGMVEYFWEIIFEASSQLINVLNPNLYQWIDDRYRKYRHLIERVQKKYLYELRNNQEMRNLLCEVACVVTLSKKNTLLLHRPPIYDSDFHNQIIKDHSVAEDYIEIKKYTSKKDDTEVVLACNEILNVLKFNSNTSAIYWYHWLDKLTLMKKKNKEMLHCQSRKITQIRESFWTDWVWIIWNILLDHSKKLGLDKNIRILYQFYKHNFGVASRKTKHVIVSNAILLLKYQANQQLNWRSPVIRNYYWYLQANGNINWLYQAVENNLTKAGGGGVGGSSVGGSGTVDKGLVFQKIRSYKMISVQFRKFLKKFQKEFSDESRQSDFKTKLLHQMVSFKDNPYKTGKSMEVASQNVMQTEVSNGTDKSNFNIMKKGKKHQVVLKEPTILEYYQQPNVPEEKITHWEDKFNRKTEGNVSEKEHKKKTCLISEVIPIKKKYHGSDGHHGSAVSHIVEGDEEHVSSDLVGVVGKELEVEKMLESESQLENVKEIII